MSLLQVRIRILARDVSIARSPAKDSSILNILARVTRRSVELLGLMPGERVFVRIKMVAPGRVTDASATHAPAGCYGDSCLGDP